MLGLQPLGAAAVASLAPVAAQDQRGSSGAGDWSVLGRPRKAPAPEPPRWQQEAAAAAWADAWAEVGWVEPAVARRGSARTGT